jgi:hypothetical protein
MPYLRPTDENGSALSSSGLPGLREKAADPAGRPVMFFNESLSGGIGGQYLDDGSLYLGQDCYINGIHCQASEAHLGGVVIEAC